MKNHHSLAAMTLAALGIVYGDIGTSPLYTFKETFAASQLPVNETNVFGFLSLIIWALLLIVTLKYVLFVLRADNRGEGGVVIMMQQAVQQLSGKPAWWMLLAGLTGTALFFGDAIITPAISVLSAAEGLIVINPDFEHWVMPIALTVLVILFLIQKYGTQRIGALFGPIMLAWFSVLALAGLYQISQNPHVWMAVNPYYGLHFATHHGWHGFVSLGAVVLAVTGAEALYADMGHFGRKPIQTAWLGMVLPALALNYIGQGALLLRDPSAIDNPFFKSVPQWGLIPLIVLATAATIIASQAVISGAYSLTQQAIQLGLSPRMLIKHTSDTEIGQIYMPAVNWLLLAAVLVVIVTFRTSDYLDVQRGDVQKMALAATLGRPAHPHLPRLRHHLLCVQPLEDSFRRLAATADCGVVGVHLFHLAQRPRNPAPPTIARRAGIGAFPAKPRRISAAKRAGQCRVYGQQSECGTQRAAAQPEAQ